MKLQVFFFLLIFSCATYAMDKFFAVSRDQIVLALKSYAEIFPRHREEAEKITISNSPTSEEKEKAIEQMKQLPRPKITIIGDKVIYSESDSTYESKSHDSLS